MEFELLESFISRVKKDLFLKLCLAGIVFIAIVVIFSPLISPYSPSKQFSEGLSQYGAPVPPQKKFLLGTDRLGRDLLSRIIWGARTSLSVSILASLIVTPIALFLACIAAFSPKFLDQSLLWFNDLFLAFPPLVVSIAILLSVPRTILTVTIAISVVNWAYPMRVFYGEVLSVSEQGFVESARAIGASTPRIILKHVVPQLVPLIIVIATLRVPAFILIEAALGFLGVGVKPPTPSWGNLIYEGMRLTQVAPWLFFFPGLMISITVISVNYIGDVLREILDPRTNKINTP